jgi:hypothetical protein
MKTLVHAILIASLFVGCCSAQTPTLKVIPWNNHEVALSLTFDESRPVQLDVVIPEVNKRLHAAFFLIVSKTTRLAEGQLPGQEIGNHSVRHEHAADLNMKAEELQAEDAKKFLDSNFKSDIFTFACPYTV